MNSDKKCIICGALMPNCHYLKKYCSHKCIIEVRKRRNRMKTEVRRIRNAAFLALSDKEQNEIMNDARRDIMESLNEGALLDIEKEENKNENN